MLEHPRDISKPAWLLIHLATDAQPGRPILVSIIVPTAATEAAIAMRAAMRSPPVSMGYWA